MSISGAAVIDLARGLISSGHPMGRTKLGAVHRLIRTGHCTSGSGHTRGARGTGFRGSRSTKDARAIDS